MCTQSTQKQNKAIHVHLLNNKQRRKEREKEKKKWRVMWRTEGRYWSSVQGVNKAVQRLVTLGHCAYCLVTGEECAGHSCPRIGVALLPLPPCATLLYQQEHCSRGPFVPLDFWRSLFRTSTKTPSAVRPELFLQQLSGIKLKSL